MSELDWVQAQVRQPGTTSSPLKRFLLTSPLDQVGLVPCMCRDQSRCKRVCEESRSVLPPSSPQGSTCRRWRVALSCCRTRPPEQVGELGPHKQGEPQRFRGQTRLRPRTSLLAATLDEDAKPPPCS